MKEWFKRRLQSNKMPLVLAFFIPVMITAGVCVNHGIYPFGENCFLHIDMYHQYAPFFTEFLNKLKEGSSLFYSWNLGIGTDFVSLYAYYLASPMNWFLVLCPQQFVIELMTLLIVIKIGLCGWSFAYYLRKHFHFQGYTVVLFAIFYALSAFTCAYSWDIMWLDTVWLAPLIVLGLEQLIDEKKFTLYFVTLAVSIFSNYYISIMVCIFLVLYFVILLIEKPSRIKLGSFLRFGIFSLLAGGCSAVILIPEIKILGNSGSGTVSFPRSIEWYFNALDELARSCIGVNVIATSDHWPNIYCGVAVLLLFFMFLLNREITKKTKILRVLLLVFFLVSFANNQLNFIWHGFHFPDGLPARQSFLYSFVILVVGFETIYRKKGNTWLHVGISLVLSMIMLVMFATFTDTSLVTVDSLVISGVLLGAYALVYAFYVGKDSAFKRMACIFAFLLVVTESAVNLDMTGVISTSRTSYVANLDEYKDLTERIEEKDDSFYRIEKYSRLTKNESSLSDYRSASIFSSLINLDVADFYREVGMEGGKNFYCYNGATPLISAMLSVKYLMTDSAQEESPIRTLVDSQNGMYLYENKYTLPIGYMLDSDFENNWDYEWGTSVESQNNLASALGATEDLLTPITTEVNSGSTTITVDEDSYVYVYYSDKAANNITAQIGTKIRKFSKCAHLYLLDMGWCKAGTTITMTSSDVNILQMQAYKMNLDSLDTAFSTLNEQTLVLDSYSDTSVKGHIDVDKAGKLVLAIPDDEGWTLYVDGEKTKMDSFCDALLAVSLDVGTHEIELKYETPGLKTGTMISAICLLLFAIILIVKRKREKAK